MLQKLYLKDGEDRVVQWISGRPPLAVPLCGFHGEKCRPLPGITQSQPATTTLIISDDDDDDLVNHENNSNWPQTQFSWVCKNEKAKSTLLSFTIIYSVSQKNPPCGFLKFFPKRLGIFTQFFTHLLHDPFYTRVQIFIQISPTLTKLCHTKLDHLAIF